MRSCPRIEHQPFYSCSASEANLKGETLGKWVHLELTENEKKSSFWRVVFSFSTLGSSLILYRIVSCDKKWILYENQWWPVQWLDREEASKHFPKQTCTQKRLWSLIGGLLPVWSTTTLWIPAKPTHLRSMFSKSTRHTEKCNAWAGNDQQKGPNSSLQHCLTTCRTTNTSKVNELRYKVLSPSPSSPVLLPTNYCFFKHLENFLQGKCFHNQQEAENAFLKSSSNPEVWIFTLQEQTHLFLTGKSVLTVMVPILINKDVFEPSYNDWKFTVQDRNYLFTNLITPNYMLNCTGEYTHESHILQWTNARTKPRQLLTSAATCNGEAWYLGHDAKLSRFQASLFHTTSYYISRSCRFCSCSFS